MRGNKASIIDRFGMDDKIVLIVGGGQGIGRSFAHTLGEAGARVAVADIDLVSAKRVADELKNKDVDAMAVGVDVTDKHQVEKMVDDVLQHWGGLTVAVNSAGIGGWANAESMPEAHWDSIMDVNLKGVLLCCQAEARVMLTAGYGKIINMCSVSAYIVLRPQNQAAYNASKAGVLHLSRTLAGEWASRGVRVNCISPGYTRTEMLNKLAETEEGRKMVPRWLELTPIGRLAELDDLQGAVLYLASGLSDYMTGQDLILDGGYSLW